MGGVAFDSTPDAPPAAANRRFPLFDDETAARDFVAGPKLVYQAAFPGSVANLSSGAAVELQGVSVGSVTGARLVTDAATGTVRTPVTFTIEPARVLGAAATASMGGDRGRFDALMARFVAHGLRARLASASLLTGQRKIALDFVASPKTATFDGSASPPAIPTVPGGDLDGVMQSAQTLLDHLSALPLDGLVGDIRTTVRGIGARVNSPEMNRSLRSLDSALADLAETMRQSKGDIPPLIRSLRATAEDADAAVSGASGQPGLGEMLQQLSGAARSLRLLADYLEQHPESLLRGKQGPS
jgi:paraquat-inducible protein B